MSMLADTGMGPSADDAPRAIPPPADWLRRPSCLMDADDPQPLDFRALFGDRPVEVDVGCGKGRFLLTRAARLPGHGFVGLDRLAKRLIKIDLKARRAGLANIRLLHTEAHEALLARLPPASVSLMHILFSDPWPKRRHHKRRLFNPAFLDAIAATLAPGGAVHVATDHQDYFKIILRLFAADARFMAGTPPEVSEAEQSDFEREFRKQGRTIGRALFQLRAAAVPATGEIT